MPANAAPRTIAQLEVPKDGPIRIGVRSFSCQPHSPVSAYRIADARIENVGVPLRERPVVARLPDFQVNHTKQ